MSTVIGLLKAIPGVVKIINYLVDAWQVHQDNITDKEIDEKIKQRRASLAKLKKAETDDDRRSALRDLLGC